MSLAPACGSKTPPSHSHKPEAPAKLPDDTTRSPIHDSFRSSTAGQDRRHFHNEPRQMPLRKPLIHRRRQQKAGLTVYLAKVAHRRTRISNQNRSRDSTQYPDNVFFLMIRRPP